MADVPNPLISDDTLERLREEASSRDISIDKLLAERLGADAQAAVGPSLRYACPHEDCSFRSGTLAQVCPEHGVHVV
jgi:hypothetical protein